MNPPSTSGPRGPDRIKEIEGLGGHCFVPEGLRSGPVDLVAAVVDLVAAAVELEAFCRNL